MQKIFLFFRTGLIILLGCAIFACGITKKADSNRKGDYKSSRTLPPLEVPPDLTSSTIDDTAPVPTVSSTASLSDYSSRQHLPEARIGASVLPEQSNLRVERDGDRQWLVIDGEPDKIWPVLRQFWTSNGFVIKLDEPQIGIMETEWAENRADIPRGGIRKLFGKAIDFVYSSGTRDKFRVRLERGEQEGYTELYLTHRGMEEVVQGVDGEDTATLWRPRPSDPELEAEMLKRLMVSLGVQQQRAESLLAQQVSQQPKARLTQGEDEETTLILAEPFAQAWRRTGIALDRVGFVVEDRNRSDGLYFVLYDDPEKSQKKRGWLSKLNPFGGESAKSEKYQIQLSSNESETRVIVLSKKGKQDNSGTSRRILALLYDQLK